MKIMQTNSILIDSDVEKLILDNINLVYKFVHKNIKFIFLYDDDIQEFIQSLMIPYVKCAKKYDSSKANFSTYCYQSFMNDVKQKLRKFYGSKENESLPIYMYIDDPSEQIDKYCHSLFEDMEDRIIENEIIAKAKKDKFVKDYFDTNNMIKVAKMNNCSQSNVSRKIKNIFLKLQIEYGA